MRTAVWSAEQPDFDEAKEIEARMVNFKAYYEAKLKRNKLRRAVTNKEYALLHRSLEGKITDAELDKWLGQTELVASLRFNAKTGNVATSEFDPQNYPIHPPSEETVAGILSEQKFKYTHKSYPKECPMCKREGVVEAELAFVYQQMAELRQKDEPQWSEDDKRLLLILKKCAGELETEKKTIAIHKKQLERCRSFIKQLTAKLKPGEIVIWRDFVNQYTLGCDKDVQGNQLKNLVLVMVWMENGRLYSRTFHHFCTDSSSYSTDSAYVADVFDYHLRPKSEEYPGTLERFQTLYLCGDHGSHFSGVQTLYYESTWFEQYQKKVVDFFLPSYHAFNVCDGAGVPPARIAMSLNKQGYTLLNAGDYARACNDSNSTSVAIAFDCIRRRFSKAA